MDSATNNASDMIDSLTLVMNRARQGQVTKEIIEHRERRSSAVEQHLVLSTPKVLQAKCQIAKC